MLLGKCVCGHCRKCVPRGQKSTVQQNWAAPHAAVLVPFVTSALELPEKKFQLVTALLDLSICNFGASALLSAPLSTCQLLISLSQLVLSLWICSGYDSPEWLSGTTKQLRKGKETFLEIPWFCTTSSGRFCKFWLKFVNLKNSFKSEPVPMRHFIQNSKASGSRTGQLVWPRNGHLEVFPQRNPRRRDCPAHECGVNNLLIFVWLLHPGLFVFSD